MRPMAAISGIEAPLAQREQKERTAVDFGGAVTHSELVQQKLRVDPVALAEKKRQPDPARKRDEPPREREEPGSRLDITV
jgi:hypothetical protein